MPLVSGSASLVIDLGRLRDIQSVKIILDDNSIDSLWYTIEGAADQSFIWGGLSDFSQKPQLCMSQEITEAKTTGKIAGFAENVSHKFNEARFNGLCRFLRISFLPGKGSVNQVSVSEVEVYAPDNYSKDKFSGFKEKSFDDSKWQDVGIPHCFNDSDTYLNSYETNMWKGEVWYRKHLFLEKNDRDKQFYLEFEGVNVGTAVYINGVFKKGNTGVVQTGDVTNIGCFIPFSVDITSQLKFGEDNVITVRVANSAG